MMKPYPAELGEARLGQGSDTGVPSPFGTPVSDPCPKEKKFDAGLYKLFDICIKYRYTISLWICV